MMYFHHYGYGIGGLIFMGISIILGLVFFIGLIVWAVRGGRSHSGMPYRKDETPEEILKRRYANGEIKQKEYREMLSEIKKKG